MSDAGSSIYFAPTICKLFGFADELVVYTKRQMQRRGFHSPEFAGLPRDMGCGSRELLLGLGWLVCKENIIQRFMHSCTSPLEEDTFNNHQVCNTSVQGFLKFLDLKNKLTSPMEEGKL